MKKTIFAAWLIAALAGCKTSPVIPYSNGTYQTTATGRTEASALKIALRSAGKSCDDVGKRPSVVIQKTAYQGVFDEDTNRTYGKVTQHIPFVSTGEDYQIVMNFTCR